MSSVRHYLESFFKFFLDVDKEERIKVFLLTISFFFVIGAYTVVKELKDSIFVSVVGADYQPKAKMIVIFFLVENGQGQPVERRLQTLFAHDLGEPNMIIPVVIGHVWRGKLNARHAERKDREEQHGYPPRRGKKFHQK